MYKGTTAADGENRDGVATGKGTHRLNAEQQVPK